MGVKISDLTAASSVADANEFEINESGTSKKVTASQIKSYATNATSVTAAGALMDSELADVAAVKAINQALTTSSSPTFGGMTTTGDISFGDNDKAVFGTGSDLQIYHDGSNSIIKDAGTGDLIIGADNNVVLADAALAEVKALFTTNGPASLYYDNSSKLATTATGIDVTGTAVTDGLTVAGNLSVDGGTIKLDGNYPVGTGNVALGDAALDDGSLTGNYNVAVGLNTLTALTSGGNNTALGANAGLAATTADMSVFVGRAAGVAVTTGDYNTAIGGEALKSNTTANGNTAVGYRALYDNTTGSPLTAVGYLALANNTTGVHNTAFGTEALLTATTSQQNTAVGSHAMQLTTTGSYNVAVGREALHSNTTASNNVAVGYQAGYSGTTAFNNTYVGIQAGYSATTPQQNTFIGRNAGYHVSTGGKNTILGCYTGNQGGLDIRTSSNNIVLSDGDGNPRVHIDSSGRTTALATIGGHHTKFQNTHGSSPDILWLNMSDAAPDNNSQYFVYCSDSSTLRCAIWSDGDIDNHDNSYGGTSDQKLKQQITDASSQWDDIKALQVRKFKFNDDVETHGDSDEHWRLGVIAQEVETAGMSGLVSDRVDKDADGNALETTTKSVKYSVLYMKAVKALQEAMDRIETLEAKVTALENV